MSFGIVVDGVIVILIQLSYTNYGITGYSDYGSLSNSSSFLIIWNSVADHFIIHPKLFNLHAFIFW